MVKFIVYQNQSLSWRGNQLFFLTMFCVSFTIAFAFAWQGLWLVIPFAGIEMLALGLALYLCMYRLSRVETIAISDRDIMISVRQRNKMRMCCSLPKNYARASVFSPESRMQKRRLWLSACKEKIEIGAFLNDSEKHQLANAINRAILR